MTMESFISQSNLNSWCKESLIQVNKSIKVCENYWYSKSPSLAGVENLRLLEHQIDNIIGIVTFQDDNQKEETRLVYLFKFVDSYEILTKDGNKYIHDKLQCPTDELVTNRNLIITNINKLKPIYSRVVKLANDPKLEPIREIYNKNYKTA